MAAPVVERVEVFPVSVPVTKTFTFASGSAGAAGAGAPHVFVRVTGSDGAVGWGEGRPMPGWSYETVESVVTTLRRYVASAVVGMPASDRWALHRRMQRVIGRGPSVGQPIARSAIDMALHDLAARQAGLSLRAFLGGSDARNRVALSWTVTAHEPEGAAAEVTQALDAGFMNLNFKAAIAPVRTWHDAALGSAIRESAGKEAFVWADANQGYQLHQARLAARSFLDVGVDVLEQPLAADQLPLMVQLRAQTALPLAVDEASVGATEFLRYVEARLVDYVVVKLSRNGGIWPTMQQLAIAEAAGLPILVSGLTETLLSKVAACQVASVYGFEGPAALNGNQFLDEAALYPEKGAIEQGATVMLPESPGIGVVPDFAALERLAIRELWQ